MVTTSSTTSPWLNGSHENSLLRCSIISLTLISIIQRRRNKGWTVSVDELTVSVDKLTSRQVDELMVSVGELKVSVDELTESVDKLTSGQVNELMVSVDELTVSVDKLTG